MWFARQRQHLRPAIVPARDGIPDAVLLTFDRHAIDPDTHEPRLGVLIEDGLTREPIAARSVRDAADWLKSHDYRFAGVNGLWTRLPAAPH